MAWRLRSSLNYMYSAVGTPFCRNFKLSFFLGGNTVAIWQQVRQDEATKKQMHCRRLRRSLHGNLPGTGGLGQENMRPGHCCNGSTCRRCSPPPTPSQPDRPHRCCRHSHHRYVFHCGRICPSRVHCDSRMPNKEQTPTCSNQTKRRAAWCWLG